MTPVARYDFDRCSLRPFRPFDAGRRQQRPMPLARGAFVGPGSTIRPRRTVSMTVRIGRNRDGTSRAFTQATVNLCAFETWDTLMQADACAIAP